MRVEQSRSVAFRLQQRTRTSFFEGTTVSAVYPSGVQRPTKVHGRPLEALQPRISLPICNTQILFTVLSLVAWKCYCNTSISFIFFLLSILRIQRLIMNVIPRPVRGATLPMTCSSQALSFCFPCIGLYRLSALQLPPQPQLHFLHFFFHLPFALYKFSN